MKILFYVFATPETGLGHIFRSTALVQAATEAGHTVAIMSNRKPPVGQWLDAHYLQKQQLSAALDVIQPDWLVVDLPDTLPPWVEELVGSRAKICVLNGIGYDQANNVALRVIQGVNDIQLPRRMTPKNTLIGSEYVILRSEIEAVKRGGERDYWLVWGGARDYMKLLPAFSEAYKDEMCLMLRVPMTPEYKIVNRNHTTLTTRKDLDIFNWIAGAKAVVCAMGVIAWECAYIGVPAYVFSYTDLHLTFARGMSAHGLIRSYPEVGLPNVEAIRNFTKGRLFKVDKESGMIPDNKGAARIVKEMEKRS
jgi:spore coat polysaccharide biosynthesis predicted glycosyltransferase SpsG